MDEAIRLYSEESTFAEIADELEVSKSYAQKLVRMGIAKTLDKLGNEKLIEMADNDKEPENEAPTSAGGSISDLPMVSHKPQFIPAPPMVMPQPQRQPLSYQNPAQPLPVDPYELHHYELEMTAIDKKLTMTGFEILIFDNFVNNGYKGTFSDFCREAIQALYYRTTPRGRAM